MLEQYKYYLVSYSIAVKQKGEKDPEVKEMSKRLQSMELVMSSETIINCTREAFTPPTHPPFTAQLKTYLP